MMAPFRELIERIRGEVREPVPAPCPEHLRDEFAG